MGENMEKKENCSFCKYSGTTEDGYIIKVTVHHPENDFGIKYCPDCYNKLITKNLTNKAKKELNLREEFFANSIQFTPADLGPSFQKTIHFSGRKDFHFPDSFDIHQWRASTDCHYAFHNGEHIILFHDDFLSFRGKHTIYELFTQFTVATKIRNTYELKLNRKWFVEI